MVRQRARETGCGLADQSFSQGFHGHLDSDSSSSSIIWRESCELYRIRCISKLSGSLARALLLAHGEKHFMVRAPLHAYAIIATAAALAIGAENHIRSTFLK